MSGNLLIDARLLTFCVSVLNPRFELWEWINVMTLSNLKLTVTLHGLKWFFGYVKKRLIGHIYGTSARLISVNNFRSLNTCEYALLYVHFKMQFMSVRFLRELSLILLVPAVYFRSKSKVDVVVESVFTSLTAIVKRSVELARSKLTFSICL